MGSAVQKLSLPKKRSKVMKAVKRAIILCWAMLIACFIIKLFGGNWFEIICNNEHFIYICAYIDNHIPIRDLIAFPLYVSSTFLVFISSSFIEKPTKKQTIFILISIFAMWAMHYLSYLAKIITEMVVFVCIPTAVNLIEKRDKRVSEVIKHTWYKGIIGCALNLTFQTISLLTKNVGIKITDSNFLVSIILMIDYYIMVVLYYLYIKLKIKQKKE